MASGDLRKELRAASPALFAQVDALTAAWLAKLLDQIRRDGTLGFRPKQVNDPIWGTIELLPWEVALLDTPLLQRMRGVRQLGLAQLVFPGAAHDRLEHTIGIIGAVDDMIQALNGQISRWNRENKRKQLPLIDDRDRYAIRLSALLHDIGHGPFSHALEPILEIESPLLDSHAQPDDWRVELRTLQTSLQEKYVLNKVPAASEAMAVAMVLSDAMTEVLSADSLFTDRGRPVAELLELMVAAIIGGIQGPGASHLSALISSQVDCDKLDYLARDAHHAGLEIGFDTDRLLARLELLHVTEDNVDPRAEGLAERARNSPDKAYHDIGIAASGFGSFEQMLIGRTFLYDRLYHHHKVRAAEAMAQRLILVAERDRKRRLSLDEIFLRVSDDTLLRILSGEVTHPKLQVDSPSASALAQGILDRVLLHRAFAFRGRFIASPPGITGETANTNRQVLWGRIVKQLDGLKSRFTLGQEIHGLALACAQALEAGGVDTKEMAGFKQALEEVGPEQIIVDLPALKADAIRILARYPNGSLKVPEFSFNPVKWSDAYELQKRTGYVFCPRSIVPIVALASKIVFLTNYGVTMDETADGYIKAGQEVPQGWLDVLVNAGVIDRSVASHLTADRHSLIKILSENLRVPEEWVKEDPDFDGKLAGQLNKHLKAGLTAEDLKALGDVLAAMYAFVDTWMTGGRATKPLEDEAALQERLRDCFCHRGIKVDEGTKVNGGALDLFVANAILVENKFHGRTHAPARVAAAAGMQGRRYAIALGSQVVIVACAYEPAGKKMLRKTESITVHPVEDLNRVEIRFAVPYNAPVPSAETAADGR